jgi:hypothetical protein
MFTIDGGSRAFERAAGPLKGGEDLAGFGGSNPA